MKNILRILLTLAVVFISIPSVYSQDDLTVASDGFRYGFKDKTGKFVIQPRFERAWNFCEGLAKVQLKGRYGFIDKTGNFVILPQFDQANNFSEGLAIVYENSKYGFIDKTGKFVVEPKFDYAWSFDDGVAMVKWYGKESYINKAGQIFNDKKRAKLSNEKTQTQLQERSLEIGKAKIQERSAESLSSYIDYYLGAKSDFLKKKGIAPLNDAIIKTHVEAEVNKWQVKDEFESTAEWKQRVNDATRNAKAREISQRYVDEYNKKLSAASADYDKKYAILVGEYKGIANKKFKEQSIELKPYDADNETFLISTAEFGDFLLPVPKAEARDFKANWESIKRGVTAEFVPVGDEMELKSVKFGKYVYDSNTQASYAQVEADYNFRPVEIPDIDYNFDALAQQTPATTVTTVDNKTLKPKTVEPVKNKLSVGNMADVDMAIPTGKTKRENTFALVIANENYKRVKEVPYALNDGRVLKEYLNKTLGLPDKNIFSVTDASLNDISYNVKRIADICRAYRGDATLIVYYAGHGVPDEASKDAYLLPVDGYAEAPSTSGVSLKSLIADLEQLPTRQTVMFVDACFSGANRDDDMLLAARGVRIKPREEVVTGNNLVMISATQGNQTAGQYSEKAHGLFTYFLLKKLRETGGDVTLGELSDYIVQGVERQSAVSGKPQTPTVTVSHGNTAWSSVKL